MGCGTRQSAGIEIDAVTRRQAGLDRGMAGRCSPLPHTSEVSPDSTACGSRVKTENSCRRWHARGVGVEKGWRTPAQPGSATTGRSRVLRPQASCRGSTACAFARVARSIGASPVRQPPRAGWLSRSRPPATAPWSSPPPRILRDASNAPLLRRMGSVAETTGELHGEGRFLLICALSPDWVRHPG